MKINNMAHVDAPSLWLYGILRNNNYIKELSTEIKNSLTFTIDQMINTVIKNDSQEVAEKWINERVELYNSNADLEYLKGKLNEKKEYQLFMHNEEDQSIDSEAWRKEIASFYVMKILSKANNNIKSWIINNEVQLFLKRLYCYISSKKSSNAYSIIKTLLYWIYEEKEEIVISADSIKLNWKVGLDLFDKKEHYLLNEGFISIPFDSRELQNQQNHNSSEFIIVDELITHRLRSILYEDFEAFIVPNNHKTSMYSDMQSQILENEILSGEVHNSIQNLESEIFPSTPLCILDLDAKIMAGLGSNYGEALQLSFYMKQFLDLDDLRTYFWSRDARNNKYKSAEEMYKANPKLASLLKQEYGYDNSNKQVKKSYQPYKCSNCQSSRHCFFTDTPNDVICELQEKYIDVIADDNTEYLANQLLKKIEYAVKHEYFSSACGYEMFLRVLQYCQAILPLTELEKLRNKSCDEYISTIKSLIKQKISMQIFYPVQHYYLRMFNMLKKINEIYGV